MLTPTQKSSLDHQGYLHLPNIVPTPQLATILTAIPTSHGHRGLLDLPVIHALANAGPLHDIAQSILGPNALPFRSLWFDKLPTANWKVPWHQDVAIAVRERIDTPGFGPWSVKNGVHHVQPQAEILANIIALRLFLDECNPDNGPLRVLPGSHQYGILDDPAIKKFKSEIPETPCTGNAGDVLLMRPLLLHASSPSKSPTHRRVLHIEYANAALPAGLHWACK